MTPVSTLLTYNTVGSTIGTTGVTGAPVITFIPATGSTKTDTNAQVQTPSNMSLGQFEVAAPAAGSSTTYTNTPFTINLSPTAVNGTALTGADLTPIQITGHLNGTVAGPGQTDVTAAFDPLTSSQSQFTTGLYSQTLALSTSSLALVPSATNNGDATVQGHVASQTPLANAAPEPSTVALFAVTLAGLAGWRARSRSRRAAAV
jgi:hypothetical protein